MRFKAMVAGALLLAATSLSAQEITRTYVKDSLIFTEVKEGDIVTLYRGDRTQKLSSIEYNDNGMVYNTSIKMLYIREKNMTSIYYWIDGEWKLERITVTTDENGVTPKFKNRCEGITTRGTRCKRTAYDGFCWQHDKE